MCLHNFINHVSFNKIAVLVPQKWNHSFASAKSILAIQCLQIPLCCSSLQLIRLVFFFLQTFSCPLIWEQSNVQQSQDIRRTGTCQTAEHFIFLSYIIQPIQLILASSEQYCYRLNAIYGVYQHGCILVQLVLHFNAVRMGFCSEKQTHVSFSALVDVYIVVRSDKFVPLRFVEWANVPSRGLSFDDTVLVAFNLTFQSIESRWGSF